MSECSFLGFTIVGKKMRWTDKALADFKHRIRELTGRVHGAPAAQTGAVSSGLGGVLRHQPVLPVPCPDWTSGSEGGCACATGAWRWARTKIRNLLALGVSLKSAIQHGVSSNSYWQMSSTPVVQQAVSNAWLKEQGLLSVKELWCKAQGYTEKREERN